MISPAKPRIVCLCGSTRFKQAFLDAEARERAAGHIVLSVETFAHADMGGDAEEVMGREVKARLDALHLAKISTADEVLVIDVDGYLGSSTINEILYASNVANKPIRFLAPPSSVVLDGLAPWLRVLILRAAGFTFQIPFARAAEAQP